MNENLKSHKFKIDDWVVDIDRGGVFEGEKFTRLEPKPMKVLQYLAHANCAFDAASELKENIWNETHIADEVSSDVFRRFGLVLATIHGSNK